MKRGARYASLQSLLTTTAFACAALLVGSLLAARAARGQAVLQFFDSGQVLSQGVCTDVVLEDLDRDGDLDLVVTCGTVGGVWINPGGRQPGQPGTFPFPQVPNTPLGGLTAAVALKDLDSDDYPDLVLLRSTFLLETWLNQSGAPGTLKQTFTQPLGATSGSAIAIGNLDGADGPDVFETRLNQGDRVWTSNGSGAFNDSGQILPNGFGVKVALADLDGDGDLDAYVIGSPDKVWINQGGRQGGTAGAFVDSGLSPGAGGTTGVALADLDHDGRVDVVVANGNGGAPFTVYRNVTPPGGNLALVELAQPSLAFNDSLSIAVGDMDGDGFPDVVVGAIDGTIWVYLNDGNGVFGDPSRTITFGGPNTTAYALALGDVDHDGDRDVVIGTSSGATIWLNQRLSPPPPSPTPRYNSSPPPGSLIDLGVAYSSPVIRPYQWLILANDGTAPLTIHAIDQSPPPLVLDPDGRVRKGVGFIVLDAYGMTPNERLVGQAVTLPQVLDPGEHLFVLLECGAGGNGPDARYDGTLTVTNDGAASQPVTSEYRFTCTTTEGTIGPFELVLLQLVQAPPPRAALRTTAVVTASPSMCSETATLALDASAPRSLTVQVPDTFGGGTLQVPDFAGSLTVNLQPVPAAPTHCAIKVAGGTFTAPSITLPSGIATGPNTLTFGPVGQSQGLLDLTTGAFTATATGTIVNDLFREGIALAGSYSGTADITAGRVSVQSQTQDILPASTLADTTPPEITPMVSGQLGANGWYVGNVTVSWKVRDPETNITSITGCTATTVTADTSGQTLSCAATSAGGTTTHAGVTVKRDITAPVLSGVPGNLTMEATSAAGAAVTYTNPTATDTLSGVGAPSCAPASGAIVPLGSTTVNCIAQDNAGNVSSASFLVSVRDTTSPSLTCPPNVTATEGQPVNLGTPTVSDAADTTPTVTSNAPPSFPVGTTPVTWTATDAAGNRASCIQQVIVVATPGGPGGNTVSVTAPDPFANEAGLKPGRFRVSRAGSAASALAVFYTVGGTATPGSDYVALPGTVSIAAGQVSADILVKPLHDNLQELPETITVTLTANSAYTVGNPGSATAVVLSKEPLTQVVSVFAVDHIASEAGLALGRFLVTRVGSVAVALTVSYSVGGTATPGIDYVALPGAVTIPAGASAALILVTPLQDTVPESPETVTLTLSQSPSYAVGIPANATVTVVSDD